jgi:putative DNA primase/helicase
MTTKTTAWYAQRYAEKYGFQVVPLKPNSKLPIRKDWGNETLDATAAPDYFEQNHEHNIGLALGPSGMCSLDIDCEASWTLILEEFGIPSDALDGYPTIQGKGKRVLFRVPADAAIKYAKLNWPRQGNPARHFTVFELRVATEDKQRFDVLPPSMHPDTGEPYRWIVQPPRSAEEWPEPPSWLLAIWEAWDCFKPQMRDVCPWVERPKPPAPKQYTTGDYNGDSPIQLYRRDHPLLAELHRHGYKQVGKRLLSPHSGTGLPGVTVFHDEESCWIHHASDPLCSEESGKPVNAFDLYCYYEHGGDVSKAVKQLAEEYGLTQQNTERKKPEPIPAMVDPTPVAEDKPKPSAPFKALGYNGDYYYYLPRGTEQVVCIKRGSHTSPAELMGLASIEWWECNYEKEGKQKGCDWQMAASAMMRACERCGIYSPDRERGRGAWYDEGRSVLHMGDHLLVDGIPTAISDHSSRFIYTKGAQVDSGIAREPLPVSESAVVLDLFKRLAWVKPIHAELLAGWCTLAPVCGALKWRPHVWITAQRGGGKSWVQDRMVSPLIGPMAMVVQGGTTEAGIRQKTANDARSIVFDEAEAETQAGQKRIGGVLELARQSSSDTSAEIVKGTVGGHAMGFRMRSMFLMGSINVAITQAADESRFSVVQLNKPQMTSAEFSEFERMVDSTLSDDFCSRHRTRIYLMIATIRQSAKILADAVAVRLGSQRIGDQVGTLLAGAWALKSDSVITDAEAVEWVSQIDLTDAHEAEQVADEIMCLQAILQSQIRFDGTGSTLTRSVGELLEAVVSGYGVDPMVASDALARHGVRLKDGMIYVSNTHSEIKKMLSDTPWSGSWRRILARIPGAVAPTSSVRFAGSTTKSVAIPYAQSL